MANVAEQFDHIVEIREQFPFEAFFCDGGTYVEKLVAERLHVPVFATGMSMVLPDRTSPPPFFGLRPARTALGRAQHRIGRATLTATMKRGVGHCNDILAAHDLAPLPANGFPHGPMASARRVFLDGTPGLEFPGYRPPANAQFVGPLIPAETALGPDVPLLTAVTRPGATVVAISQGTVDNADPSKLIEPALQALAGGPRVVVVTTGSVRNEQLRARYASPDVVIEDYLPYRQLFPHVTAFITNGGYGCVVAALRHGVPVVTAGTREGNNDINARIAYCGLGVDLRTERPSPKRIRAAVGQIFNGQRVAARISALRAEFTAYDPLATITAAVEAEHTHQVPTDLQRRSHRGS